MRRTKEDAARTRAAVVEAALSCFDRHGIAGSTLAQIAASAHVTKGAVYHHFGGKRQILHELREQVSLPMLDEADTALLQARELPALDRVEHFLLRILDGLENDRRMRRTLAVMQFKCEYVDDLAEELAGLVRNHRRLAAAFEGAYREARKAGTLAKHLTPEIAALETVMFLSGLVRLWLLHAGRHPLGKDARAVIRAHVQSRKGEHPAPPPGSV
jgi:TetR/AcrR family transcriptional regulator, acrAB operon repressor